MSKSNRLHWPRGTFPIELVDRYFDKPENARRGGLAKAGLATAAVALTRCERYCQLRGLGAAEALSYHYSRANKRPHRRWGITARFDDSQSHLPSREGP